MARQQGYCDAGDLLIASNFPVPTGFNKQKYVNDAADEIDIAVGRLYRTPILIQGADAMEKYQVTLTFLSHLNAHLATGRLILSIAAPGEDGQLNAYGRSLVERVEGILREVRDGEIVLEGAPTNPNNPGSGAGDNTPMMRVVNLDAESGVEHFYNNILNQPPALYPYRISGG